MKKEIDMTLFRDAVKVLVAQLFEAKKLSRTVYATLTSVSPLVFSRGQNISIKAESITIPYGASFKPEDIGSIHVFIQEEGWQKYTYLYRKG